MIYFGFEVNFGCFEGVILRKGDIEEEDSSFVGAIFGSDECGCPVVEVIIFCGSCTAIGGGVIFNIGEFFLDSFEARHIVIGNIFCK